MKNFKVFLIPEGSNLKVFRMILLILIFVFCAFAFNWNFQNRIDKLNSLFIDDKSKIISKDEMLLLSNIHMSFKDQLGIGIDILVDNNMNKTLIVPSLKANSIFIGVNVASHEALLIIPMLVKKIVGEGNRILLEEELSTCLQKNTAFQCISNVSNTILVIITEK